MTIRITARDDSGVESLRVYVNGHKVPTNSAEPSGAVISRAQLDERREPGATHVGVLALAKDKLGNTIAELKELAVAKSSDWRQRTGGRDVPASEPQPRRCGIHDAACFVISPPRRTAILGAQAVSQPIAHEHAAFYVVTDHVSALGGRRLIRSSS